MKRFATVMALVASFAIASAAGAFTVNTGYDTTATSKAAVRYRNLQQGAGRAGKIYLGVPDLGVAANRTEKQFYRGTDINGDVVYGSWQSSNAFTYTYSAATGIESTTIDCSHTFYTERNVGDLGALNYLKIDVAARDAGTTVGIHDVVLSTGGVDYQLGDFDAVYSQFKTWNVKGIDFTNGFTITGNMLLSGTFGTSEERSKVDLTVGSAVPEPGSIIVLFSGLAGLGGFLKLRKS